MKYGVPPTLVSLVSKLRSVPLFAGLNERSLRRIARMVTEFEAPSGTVLVQPRSPGSGMFVIEEGTAVVEAPGRTIELGPGEFFGELALLTPEAVRAARVRARTAVRCLAISRSDFTKMLAEEPRLALTMLEVIARRLAQVVSP